MTKSYGNWKNRNNSQERISRENSRYQENGTFILDQFEVVRKSDASITFRFRNCNDLHTIPKSQICDKRFGIGMTPPQKGHDLIVVSWFFHKHLKKNLVRKSVSS